MANFRRCIAAIVSIGVAVSPMAPALAYADTPYEHLPNPRLVSDPVLRWSMILSNALSEDSTGNFGPGLHNNPGAAPRAQAIVHAAIYDAVNSILRTHEPYRTLVPVQEGTASLDAAVATAGYLGMKGMYPNQDAMIHDEYVAHLSEIADGPEKQLGIIVGTIAAENIIAERESDGSEIAGDYTPSDQPGFHRKDPINPGQPYWGPVWGDVDPFVMTSGSQFRIAPPPALDSEEYAEAYNDVKSLGGDGVSTETDRTEEQTEIGLFWAYDGAKKMGVPPRLYNQIAFQIAEEQGNTTEENARMFALMNLAQADAGIGAWESKYYYNFWRPIIGIREADEGTGPSGLGDGNEATEGDTEWTPLGAPSSNNTTPDFTPPFPAYPSGHATFGAATLHTLALFYGTDEIPFTFTSDELNGVTLDNDGTVRPLSPRSFNNFTEAIEENGRSRIYLGIHWQFDADGGIEMGTNIAEWTFANYLRPTEDLVDCTPEGEELPEGGIRCITASGYDVTPSMDLPASAQRGSTFVADLVVENTGPGSATGAVLTVDLPENVTFNGVVSGSCSLSGSTLVCENLDAPANGSASAEVELNLAEGMSCPSEVTFSPTVSAENDFYGPNNSGEEFSMTVDCEPETDMKSTLIGPSSINEGDTIGITLLLENFGPASATNAHGDITLPTGVSFVAGSSDSDCTQVGTVIRCTSATGIAKDASESFDVVFTPVALVSCGSDYAFQATAESAQEEVDPSNDDSNQLRVTQNCAEGEDDDGGSEGGQSIEEIREQIQEEKQAENPGSGRGSGTNEAMVALKLLCKQNGMDMDEEYAGGSYRMRNGSLMESQVASDEDEIVDGFTETERNILCGMKKFIAQNPHQREQNEHFMDWMIHEIAQTLHKTDKEIKDALKSETLCAK